jgi:hypothetical protein
LSFNGNKQSTSWGRFITKDIRLEEKLFHLATQARDQAAEYLHSIGYTSGYQI